MNKLYPWPNTLSQTLAVGFRFLLTASNKTTSTAVGFSVASRTRQGDWLSGVGSRGLELKNPSRQHHGLGFKVNPNPPGTYYIRPWGLLYPI